MMKNVIFRVTARYMKLNKKRTALTLLGIMLTVMLMTCVYAGKDTALAYLSKLGEQKSGSWHVTLYDADAETAGRFTSLPYIADTTVSENFGNIVFEKSANTERPFLSVKAYSEKNFDWMAIELREGRLPENSGEIVISGAALDDGAVVSVGDVIGGEFFTRTLQATGNGNVVETVLPYYGLTLRAGEEPVEVGQDMCLWEGNDSILEQRVYSGVSAEYTVVGIIDAPKFESSSSAGYIALTRLDESVLSEKTNLTMRLDLGSRELPEYYYSDMKALAGDCEIDFNNYALAFSGFSADSTVNTITKLVTALFVVLIMLASVLLIYNLFGISLEERMRYLGQLGSAGATGFQKSAGVFFEALVLLAAALPAGILLGFGLVCGGMLLLRPYLADFANLGEYTESVPVALKFSWSALLWIIVMSAVTVLVSAFIPAIKVSKAAPVESIRGSAEKSGRRTHRMNERLMEKTNAEIWLAHTGFMRSLSGNGAIIRAAAVFMVVLIVTSFASGLATDTAKDVLEIGKYESLVSEDIDYTISCSGGSEEARAICDALVDELKNSDGVELLEEEWSEMFAADIEASVLSEQFRTAKHAIIANILGHEPTAEELKKYNSDYAFLCYKALPDDKFAEFAKKNGAEITSSSDAPDTVNAIVVQTGQYTSNNFGIEGMSAERFLSFDLEKMTDLEKGDVFDAALHTSEDTEAKYSVKVAGFTSGRYYVAPEYLTVIISESDMMKIYALQGESSVRSSYSCVVRLSGKDSALETRLDEMCDTDEGSLYDSFEGNCVINRKTDMNTIAGAVIGVANTMLICFVILVSVICLLNLANSIRSRLLARRQELAALRSVGMSDGQMRATLLYEALGCTAASLIAAILCAGLIVWALNAVMSGILGYSVFRFPWLPAVLASVIAAAAVCGFTLLFASRTEKENLIEEIRRSVV